MTASNTLGRVLIPLDGSDLAEQAIPFAAELNTNGSDVTFLQIGNNEAAAMASLEKSWEKWKPVLHTKPTFKVASGDPSEVIVETAAKGGYGLILIASHGRGAIRRWALGSVADRVARASAVPVMIIRPGTGVVEFGPADINRIIVPTDGSELSAEALPVVIAAAHQTKSGVHLIRVINPTVMSPSAPMVDPAFPAQVYNELEEELEDQAKQGLEAVAASISSQGITVTWEVLIGPPATMIEERSQAGDLIIMTSHGRSGFKRWLIGSVAEKLVREARAPVMLVPSSSRTAALVGDMPGM